MRIFYQQTGQWNENSIDTSDTSGSGSTPRSPIDINKLSLMLAFLVAVVGFPVVYINQPLHFDEAIFLTVGEQVATGATLYRDIADHKPPAMLYLAAGVYNSGLPPVYLARLITYAAIAASGLLVVRVGRTLLAPVASWGAGLLFVVMAYLPHFEGYFFITEPFVVLSLLSAAVLFTKDSQLFDVLTGIALATGVLFNQTVLFFGGTIILLFVIGFRYSDNRTQEFISASIRRILMIGVGFLSAMAVVFLLLAGEGILRETIYYSIVVPVMGYNMPFDPVGHLYAVGSLLPVWLLTGGVVSWSVVGVGQGIRLDRRFLFIVLWAVVMSLPGIKAFSGEHRFLFAFPAIAILSIVGVVKLKTRTVSHRKQLLEVRHRFPDKSALLTGVIVVAVVSTTVVAISGNAYAFSNRVGDNIQNQQAAASGILEGVDGPVYGYNVRGELYVFSDATPGTTFIGTLYSEDIASSKISDIEQNNVNHVVVGAGLVSDGEIVARGYWSSHKALMADYLNEHYERVRTTDEYVLFSRTCESES